MSLHFFFSGLYEVSKAGETPGYLSTYYLSLHNHLTPDPPTDANEPRSVYCFNSRGQLMSFDYVPVSYRGMSDKLIIVTVEFPSCHYSLFWLWKFLKFYIEEWVLFLLAILKGYRRVVLRYQFFAVGRIVIDFKIKS